MMLQAKRENSEVSNSDFPDLVDIERAVWDDLGNGPEIVDWVYVRVSLPAKIELDEMIVDSTTDPPQRQLLFDFMLSEPLPLEPDDQLTAEDGATYRLLSLEHHGALPIAKAIRTEI